MLTRAATATRRAEGRCMTPACEFYQVRHGNGKCSGCANRLSVAAPEMRAAVIVVRVLTARGIVTPAPNVAMHALLPQIRAGRMARATMLALIHTYKFLLECGEPPFLMSTAQARLLFEAVRDCAVHTATDHEMASLHGVILAFSATPWDFGKDMKSGLVSSDAVCYWGNMGEPAVSEQAYLRLTINRDLALRGRSSIDRPL